MDKIYKNQFSKYSSITLCNIHFWTANIATCFAISSNWQKQLDRVGKRWLAKCRLSQQGLETALLTRLQLGECTHSYNQPVLNQVITFSWEERVVLKICRKTAYCRGRGRMVGGKEGMFEVGITDATPPWSRVINKMWPLLSIQRMLV